MTPTLPPELIEPDVSTRVMAPLWDYLAESWGDQIADSVFERAGLPPAYVRDPSGWVSWEYALHLVDELNRQLFGLEELPDPGHPLWEIYRQAGRRSLTREAMGALWPVVRLLGSPAMVFRVLERESRKVNRVAIMRTVELGRGFARVESWSPDGRDNPGLCASRVGYFEGVPTVWGLSSRSTARRGSSPWWEGCSAP